MFANFFRVKGVIFQFKLKLSGYSTISKTNPGQISGNVSKMSKDIPKSFRSNSHGDTDLLVLLLSEVFKRQELPPLAWVEKLKCVS